MKTSSIILLGLVVLANFTTLSFCKPTPLNAEQAQDVAPAGRIVYDARRLWNEAKKAHKKIYQHLDRQARQAGSSDEVDQSENEEDIYKYLEQRSNATGRRYMLDLYKKIRNSSLNTPLTQANTIKSLTYFPDSVQEACNKFKFSLAGVTRSEFILQTKLRLYLNGIVPTETPATYIVIIRVENYVSSSIKEISPSENGYVEFEVADIFRPVVGKEKSITFVVQVYKSPLILLDCGQDVAFVDDSHENKIPVLVVYSYERPLKNVDINTTVLDQQLQNSNISIAKSNISTAKSNTTVSRRKRSTTQTRACSRRPLRINTQMIPPSLIGNYSSFRVFLPGSYDAGICGGSCNNNLPTSKRHPILVHLLLRYQTFLEDNPYKYKQCCTPVSYASLSVYGLGPTNQAMIHTIPNMIITDCECTDIVEPTSTPEVESQ